MMNVTAIIQARMSSSRLPGKVMMPLAGKPVLEHVVRRLGYCHSIGQTVVATSEDASDDVLAEWCQAHAVACYRGSLNDVLDRYYQAATKYSADAVVRITADCPALDPAIVDEVVQAFIAGGYEFCALQGEFPDGLDCSVFAYSALARAWREAVLPSEREHVGPYVEKHPEWFKCGAVTRFKGLGHMRWTLDEERDYQFLQQVFERLDREGEPFRAHEVLALLEREPELATINSNIVRNAGYLKSLAEERNLHVQP